MKIRNIAPVTPDRDTGIVKVDKGVPMPQVKSCHGNTVYPWRTMEVGDSFLFRSKSRQNAYCQVYSKSAMLHPKKFVTRNTDAGYRCWRVA